MYNITIKREENKEGKTMTYNQRTMNVKLERIEICDLLIACTMLEQETDAKKWGDLHDKLMATLEAFDEKNGYGVMEF
jgi:hypothetical protein